MSKRHYLVVGAVMVLAILAGLFGGAVQGKNSGTIGVVDMERVINEYVAQPLLEARDELQAKFDEESEGLEDEVEIAQLFQSYQVQLSKLEADYRRTIQKAIAEVGEKRGLEVILPAAGVLYGGTDITDDVLAVLN